MFTDMKIFAIEASGPVAACALLDGETLVAEYSVQFQKKHSQSLVPMMAAVRDLVGLDLKEIDAIAITEGPGSFTGLRIGAATAKGLGLAIERPILPVPTVDAIACNMWGARGLVCPMMDARRQQVYTGIYRFPVGGGEQAAPTGGMEILYPQCVTDLEVILDKVMEIAAETGETEVTLLGDGVPVYGARAMEILDGKLTCRFAPPHMSRQRAAATAVRAAQIYAEQGASCLVPADDFRPVYLRLSQAEQEHSERRDYRI